MTRGTATAAVPRGVAAIVVAVALAATATGTAYAAADDTEEADGARPKRSGVTFGVSGGMGVGRDVSPASRFALRIGWAFSQSMALVARGHAVIQADPEGTLGETVRYRDWYTLAVQYWLVSRVFVAAGAGVGHSGMINRFERGLDHFSRVGPALSGALGLEVAQFSHGALELRLDSAAGYLGEPVWEVGLMFGYAYY